MRTVKRISFISMAMLLSIFAISQERYSAELLWKLGRVSDMQLSPSGKTILYGVTWYNVEANKGNRDIYSLDENAESARKLTETPGSEYNAIWRPDGNKIGYLSSESGVMQIWEMGINGQDKRQLSDIEGGINGFSYAPDMKHIAFIADVAIDQSPQDLYPDLPLANALIYDDLMYRHWDNWHDYKYSHIFIAPLNADGTIGKPVDIMLNEPYDSPLMPNGGMEQITWAPDGKSIAYVSKKLKGKEYAVSTNSDIFLYNLETMKTVNLTDGNPGYDQDPVFSPDGSKMVYRSMKTPGFEADKDRIILLDIKTGEKRDLSENFDQSSSHFKFSKDGKTLYFISGIHATYQIYKLDLATGKITQITNGDHDITEFAASGNELIYSKMSMEKPTEIYKLKANGTEEQLTFTNREVLKNVVTGKVTKRWITTTDGKKMLVWVILPPSFDPNKKYPALLYCQGGPQSAVSQFFSYRWNFQMMAAHDYVIVAPNRRGLPTFGQEWNDQISGDYGGQNMKDYLTAIDSVSTEPWVNKDKLGAVGASYGGFSVYWLAGNHNKRFKTFIAHAGIFNFESMYASTEEMFFVNHDYGGAYWDSPVPKSYDFSPHLFVNNWDTPILVIHGGYDFRIPYTEGMQAYNVAQLKGIPSRFLFFPEETHFVTKPQNAILWQREFFRWLDKWLK